MMRMTIAMTTRSFRPVRCAVRKRPRLVRAMWWYWKTPFWTKVLYERWMSFIRRIRHRRPSMCGGCLTMGVSHCYSRIFCDVESDGTTVSSGSSPVCQATNSMHKDNTWPWLHYSPSSASTIPICTFSTVWTSRRTITNQRNSIKSYKRGIKTTRPFVSLILN